LLAVYQKVQKLHQASVQRSTPVAGAGIEQEQWCGQVKTKRTRWEKQNKSAGKRNEAKQNELKALGSAGR
jgi:hypothetical protein